MVSLEKPAKHLRQNHTNSKEKQPFQEAGEKRTFSHPHTHCSFCEASTVLIPKPDKNMTRREKDRPDSLMGLGRKKL
jgi:hypothetical protein